MGFSVEKVSDPSIREGTQIDYRLKIHGVPVRWRTRIETWDPPNGFRDIQLKGPYGAWVHDHTFESARGGTIMRDRIRYTLPLRALGGVVAGAWVERDVTRVFEYRREVMTDLFSDA